MREGAFMEKRRRIVLYGNSIILDTVGVSLRRLPQYEVVSLPTAQQNELEETAPDVMVFDLEATRPEAAFHMLESRPGLRLIGVSPDKNVVRIWSGKQLRELSTQDLLDVIDEH
jgi:hypothetical protein